jgi:hypothetical protein
VITKACSANNGKDPAVEHHDAAKEHGKRPYLNLERKVSVGDLLTICSILISALLVVGAWKIDRDLRRKEEANKVRAAAATTLVKLDRWEELSLSIFSKVDPAFVSLKESLQKDSKDRLKQDTARHELWKAILQAEVDVQQKILDDHVEAGYVGLYTYDPSAREEFDKVLTTLSNNQFHMYADLLMRTEAIVRRMVEEKKFDAEELYNKLNLESMAIKGDYWGSVDSTLRPVRNALTTLTSESDEELLNSPRLKTPAN